MSLFRKVLAGIATGTGNYLTEKAKADAQAARDELLWNRERALQAIKKQDSMDVNEQAGRITRENTSHTAKEQRVTNVQANELQAGREAADDERDTKNAVALKGVDHKNAVALKSVDFQNDIKAKKVAAKLELTLEDFRAKVAGGQILQDASGNYFTANKNTGTTQDIGRTGPVKDSAGGDSLSSYRPGGAAAQRAAQPIPDNFRTRWMNATADKTPGLFRGQQKIPLEEAWRLYQGN